MPRKRTSLRMRLTSEGTVSDGREQRKHRVLSRAFVPPCNLA
jgi:hypothetical protein